MRLIWRRRWESTCLNPSRCTSIHMKPGHESMKPSNSKLTKTTQLPPGFQSPGTPLAAATASPKPPRRDNLFSKSRDSREDRGTRQMKTSHNSQTLPHGKS